MKIGQIKFVPRKGDLRWNSGELMRLLSGIDPASIDIVVSPECILDGYVCTEDYMTAENIRDYAIDPWTSDHTAQISAWAKSSETWMILGCMRGDATGTYNSSLVFDRTGSMVGQYDKVHCQTHDRKYQAGRTLSVFDSDFGTFGMMICADRRWPETVRTLAIKGARVIFNPTYGMHDEHNLRMMQTRSYESETFIVFTHPQQSLITDPNGEIVVNCVDAEEYLTITEIDLSMVDRVRSGVSSHLRDRRPDVYEGLSDA